MPVYRITIRPYVIEAESLGKAADAVKDFILVDSEFLARFTSEIWEDQDDFIQATGGNIDIVVVEEHQVAQE